MVLPGKPEKVGPNVTGEVKRPKSIETLWDNSSVI